MAPDSGMSTPEDEAASLRAFLAERDEACPACGYNLRGLTGSSCPECDCPILLGVIRPNPSDGSWIAAVVPVIGLAGAGATALLFVACVAVEQGGFFLGRGEALIALWIPLLVLAIYGGAAVVMCRASFRAWLSPRATARMVVPAAMWIGALITVAIWIAMFFEA